MANRHDLALWPIWTTRTDSENKTTYFSQYKDFMLEITVSWVPKKLEMSFLLSEITKLNGSGRINSADMFKLAHHMRHSASPEMDECWKIEVGYYYLGRTDPLDYGELKTTFRYEGTIYERSVATTDERDELVAMLQERGEALIISVVL